ncbi:hypothetical protein L195_g017706 [Trifolium pratense]|uniref:Uncharacterized protein n=1 Tax=Trifolium pratense TaxID=57577 RepID=A0A2K3MV07_TRIPR|nr:hypothetical protein L195_g017706 [Trifolium pratense]
MVSKPMIQRMVRPAPCIESLPDIDGQTADPVEHRNSDTSNGWKKASA